LVAITCCFAQTLVDKVEIDSFEVQSDTLIIVVGYDAFPITQTSAVQNAGILGGERDLLLTVETGEQGLVFSTGVTGGQWSVAAPNGASGYALMQYDGVDGSIALNNVGLGGVDLTVNSASAFRTFIQSDIDTFYTFRIYSGNAESQFVQNIPGDDTTHEYVINFTSFSGSADFTNVGAIEIEVDAANNVDTFVQFFGTAGIVAESVTPTPAPSIAPSPTAAQFTWYTFDDDDNGRSPCVDNENRKTYFLSDDNIIYYYFYGFDEPAQVVTVSSAASVAASIFVLIASLALVF